jgi:hypothetical protein
MTNDHQFDELLDHALIEYRDAEPLSGMEDRVLQRLQSQPVERRNVRWIWGAIAACAALILIGVWIGVENSTTPHLPTAGKYGSPATTPHLPTDGKYGPPAEMATARAAEQPNLTPTPPKAGGVRHPTPIARAEAPTRTATTNPQFPTPAPLTEEEHALLAMLHANPDALPKPRENSDDTAIAPLEIKPLAGSTAPTQENSNE